MLQSRLGLWILLIFACACLSQTAWAETKTPPAEQPETWLVYYAQAVSPDVLARFDLVVLDPDAQPLYGVRASETEARILLMDTPG